MSKMGEREWETQAFSHGRSKSREYEAEHREYSQ